MPQWRANRNTWAAIEWANPRAHTPLTTKSGAEKNPFEIAAKLLEIGRMFQ